MVQRRWKAKLDQWAGLHVPTANSQNQALAEVACGSDNWKLSVGTGITMTVRAVREMGKSRML